MNLNSEMIPGMCVLVSGAMMAFFADAICKKKQNVPQIKLIGVGLTVIGAILIFLP